MGVYHDAHRKAMALSPPEPEKKIQRRLSRLRRIWIIFAAATLASVFALGSFWGWKHRNDPKFINYAVALVPVVLSILIAFVPDLRKAHMAWRVSIVAIGLIWSVLLWRQQALTDEAQNNAITNVVRDANEHSDQRIAEVRQDLEHAREHSDTQIGNVRTDLKETARTFVEIVSKNASDLSKKIDSTKPVPPEKAKLEFSFYTTEASKLPILVQEARVNTDLSIAVDFVFRNTSEVQAKSGEVWVQICQACEYTKEPNGFTKIAGSDERVRHQDFAVLNSGVCSPKMTVEFKGPPNAGSITTSFEYRCENCIAHPPWSDSITALLPVLRMPAFGSN